MEDARLFGQFLGVSVPVALLRTFVSRRNRTWDSLLANVLSAGVVGPAIGLLFNKWWNIEVAVVGASAAALISTDIIRGLLKIGEIVREDPAGLIKLLRGK